MPELYLMRHAESEANVLDILAGRKDFSLSARGQADAGALAQALEPRLQPRRLLVSPLRRARQTAAPLADLWGLTPEVDERLSEQDLGRFAGLTYAQAEADPGYLKDRSARWAWRPEGGGESYQDIAVRVGSFLEEWARNPVDTFVVTHAVTLRLFRACLEGTLPKYPETIAANGEVWCCSWGNGWGPLQSLDLGLTRVHRA